MTTTTPSETLDSVRRVLEHLARREASCRELAAEHERAFHQNVPNAYEAGITAQQWGAYGSQIRLARSFEGTADGYAIAAAMLRDEFGLDR